MLINSLTSLYLQLRFKKSIKTIIFEQRFDGKHLELYFPRYNSDAAEINMYQVKCDCRGEILEMIWIGLTLSPEAILLCSRRKIVCMAANAGCSLVRASPPLKQNPDFALHSWLSWVLGSRCLPRDAWGSDVFRRPSMPSRRSVASHLSFPYICDASTKAVFWFSCSRGPNFYLNLVLAFFFPKLDTFFRNNVNFVYRDPNDQQWPHSFTWQVRNGIWNYSY